MIVSTRGRYALRVMIDIACHNDGGYIPLSDIAKRQQISEKYLESIISTLSKCGLLDAMRGKGGGYRLNRAPAQYSVAEIITATEGTLAPVACLEDDTNKCARAGECKTLSMWTGLYKLITDYFEGISIADLVCDNPGDNFVI